LLTLCFPRRPKSKELMKSDAVFVAMSVVAALGAVFASAAR
jgi:hypothetical protein